MGPSDLPRPAFMPSTWTTSPGSSDFRQELFEDPLGARRPRRRLGMELDRTPRSALVSQPLVRSVVRIAEPRLPATGQSPAVHGVSVVLAGRRGSAMRTTERTR